ncbi:MAG: aminotransferase class V-fold PLP-dependent enzyme [Bacteroidetes bacterium]|nr:aminotransferase class V-fold PLP-dependent enzyme [Bacteroidota bacterium]
MDRKNFLKKAGFALAGIPTILNANIVETTSVETKPIGSNANRDWKSIAKEFSINKDIIFMNNGTMGISPNLVLKSLQEEFEKVAFKGAYPSDFNRLKKALGKIVNAPHTTLAITKNVTEGLNIACFGVELQRDDEVIMTTHEHVGGCAPWLYRAKMEGIRIKTFPLGMTAAETLDNLKKAITAKTKVIAVPHIPCTIGQIMPIKEICKLAREKGIISIVDGAHPLGMIRFDITDIDCDYYAGCLHKWLLAPLGMGYVYINPNRLNATRVHNVGAYSLNKFDMTVEIPIMDSADLVNETQRFSTGTYCGPMYEASLKAIEWYESIGIDRIEQRGKR